MNMYFLTSEACLFHEPCIQTRCKDASTWTRIVAGGMEKNMTEIHKEGIKDDGKVSGGYLGKKFLPTLKKHSIGLKVTISYSDRLTQRSLVSSTEITVNLLGCDMTWIGKGSVCVWEREKEGEGERQEEIILKRKCWGFESVLFPWGVFICFHGFNLCPLKPERNSNPSQVKKSVLLSAAIQRLASSVQFFSLPK